jgi:hypothetical protein
MGPRGRSPRLLRARRSQLGALLSLGPSLSSATMGCPAQCRQSLTGPGGLRMRVQVQEANRPSNLSPFFSLEVLHTAPCPLSSPFSPAGAASDQLLLGAGAVRGEGAAGPAGRVCSLARPGHRAGAPRSGLGRGNEGLRGFQVGVCVCECVCVCWCG